MMTMMKNPVVLVTCVLLFSSLAVLASQGNGPKKCCFQFRSMELSEDRVVSYRHTDNRCPKKGVLFKMRNGKEICAKPSQPWVQTLIEAKNAAN